MEIKVRHGQRNGTVRVPSSKSQMHRLLICAAFSEGPVSIAFRGLSEDLKATMRCLKDLGADFEARPADGQAAGPEGDIRLLVKPVPADQPAREGLLLRCGSSASTLRFLLPVCGALGASGCFIMEGRLPERPMEPFIGELRSHGMTIEAEGGELRFGGKLKAGGKPFVLPGDVSSQFISGLLLALPLLQEPGVIEIGGRIGSRPYVEMTQRVLHLAGAVAGFKMESSEALDEHTVFTTYGSGRYAMPAEVTAEGDWSAAAVFLCMGAMSVRGVRVEGLDLRSTQGDRDILRLLRRVGAVVDTDDGAVTVKRWELKGTEIEASDIPDLVPALSVVAACSEGLTRIYNAGRLKLKESDRLESIADMIRSLGGGVYVTDDGLLIEGGGISGGIVDSCGDHRIAMAAAAAASCCSGDVVVMGGECCAKSFPGFFEELEKLSVTGV
ncbi:MAG: 3-phosphoshikimate 1-carboxyvinyltransferase [Firmicutes bacterium]|nr:3-phosphoshikimate 1-carboxyvinyltransferase [Bacillota bacterium]